MKTTALITIVIFLLTSLMSGYLTHWSGSVIEANEDLIRNERVAQDVNIYAAPEILRPGDEIEATFKKLVAQSDVINSETTCRDSSAAAAVTLARLLPRCFCLNASQAFIKQVPPLPGYTFNLKKEKKRLIVAEIFDEAGNSVSEAEIYFNPMASFTIDAAGGTVGQIRQLVMLNSSNLETDVVRMSVMLENGRIGEAWFQGTDWIRLLGAIHENFKKIGGGDSENFQGATSLIEQFAKIIFLDAKDPPPAKSSLSATSGETAADEEDEDFGQTIASYIARAESMWAFTKRRVLSAYLAESLLLKFTKEEIILKSLNATNYGAEMTDVNNGKLNTAATIKENIVGLRTAAQALYNKNLEQLTPIEQGSLAIAPSEPSILRILQKKSEKRTLKESEKLSSKRTCRYLRRVKNALVRYAKLMEAEGRLEKAAIYRAESRKIPEALDCRVAAAGITDKAEEFKKLLPALRINEDDQMSAESLHLLGRENLRREVAAYIRQSGISYSQLKDLKLTVVASIKKDLQKEISKLIEAEAFDSDKNTLKSVKDTFDKRLAPKGSSFKFEIMIETFVSDQNGRILAAGSVRSDKGRVIPNRQYLNYPAFLGSTAKVPHTVAGLDSGAVTLDTVVCSSDATSPNGYSFGVPAAVECMTIGDGLRYSENWVQIVVRNLVGSEFALRAWERIANQPIEFPSNFENWRGMEKDRWLYEQTRGLNAEPVSKSMLQTIEIFTPMANEGTRSKPSFVKKLWVGSELVEPHVEQARVFNPASVVAVSALLQENGKIVFGLGEASPAVKTGSLLNAYWNVVWSRNLVLISRVVILMPQDEALDKKLKQIENKLKALRENAADYSLEIQAAQAEKSKITDELTKRQDEFLTKLKEKARDAFASDMIQPLNQKIVAYLYKKENELFKEPAD